MACTWFGEICSCCCLPLLTQLACSIHGTWGPPIRGALYNFTEEIPLRFRQGRLTRHDSDGQSNLTPYSKRSTTIDFRWAVGPPTA